MKQKTIYISSLLLVMFLSCKTSFQKPVDIDYFKGHALQYLSEIRNDEREIELADKGKVKIKIYIEQIKRNRFIIRGDFLTVSNENIPTDFDKICLDGECYDLFLFMKDKESDKDISEFYAEYQKFSDFYPYISTHFPVYKYDISKEPPKIERIY